MVSPLASSEGLPSMHTGVFSDAPHMVTLSRVPIRDMCAFSGPHSVTNVMEQCGATSSGGSSYIEKATHGTDVFVKAMRSDGDSTYMTRSLAMAMRHVAPDP